MDMSAVSQITASKHISDVSWCSAAAGAVVVLPQSPGDDPQKR